MAEVELHKERLQMLAEKRKRQAEIKDKRRQLDELILQLQRFKSKAMRDRWLMQGTPSLEDKSHRTQIEQDELSIKKLEDIVQRVESEIILLENEELRISEKEQFLRQRLQETEKSIEVLQMTLQNQEKGNEKARSVLLTAENGLYPTATAHSLDSLPIVLSNDDLTRERSHNTSKMQDWRRGLDSEAAQEILYADGVHEKNSSNKTCSPLITTVEDERFRQSGHLSDTPLLFNNEETFGGNQTVIVEENSKTKPNGHTQAQRNNYTIIPDSPSIAIKKETRFELRPFHEEKKPSKLFDVPTEKEVRVVKVRPTEEIAELEKERLELIRGQAVKKNPSIAAKWWNPPQEKTLEEELDPEQLESHRRYEERKQRSMPQAICVQSSVQPGMEKTEVAYEKSECREPQLYSAEPLLGSPDSFSNQERAVRFEPQHISCCPDDFVISTKEGSTQNETKDDFTFVRAVMTMVKDEDSDLSQRFSNSSYHTNTSGLDDSSQSQDLTLLESLGNDSGIDNISDSGASNETTNAYLDKVLEENLVPSTHKETSQTKGKQTCLEDQRQPFQQDDLTEDELQYHAGVLIENVVHQALAHQNHDWKPCPIPHSPTKDKHIPNVQLQLQPIEIITPLPSYQSNVEDTVVHPIPANNQTHSRSPLTGNERPEFSYFSKYSEAAELRSTADVTRPQEPEVNSGPFKLRSRKQRTLFMIEEEIRAAQEREEELKRQRQVNPLKVPCAQKMKNSNATSKVVFTGKTAPGKIEKIRPPVSSCSSDGVCPSPPFDLSEDSEGGQRPKNFMQTLMDDYETHKVKRREKAEDNSVLEATRVTRRKSNMALRWEAGIYANQDFLENEEDVSEE